jgi:hypothetical protein
MMTVPAEMTVVKHRLTERARREIEAATVAIDLREDGVVALSKREVAREAKRLGIDPRTLAMFLHDADIDVHPWEA